MTIFFRLLLISICFYTPLSAQDSLQHWKDQKFSMFIHFGAYSHLGGVYNGREISIGLSEQIQAHAGIYSDTYEQITRQFNPVNWNADSIALLAQQAGMRSIVLTSKHHDGFAMFNSAYTDFDVVDGTAFGRDVVGEMAAACRKYKLRFGLYFSLIDWHYPHAYPISSHNSDPITAEHHQYNLNQISELLSNYGEISELWFDMGSMTLEQSREMRELVKKLQPNCMIGSRIGNDMGDFTVMSDNQEPDYIIGVPWQSPASFFHETWGYRSWQKTVPQEEKYREKLSSLIRVISRGGNYLLNIGPKGDGSVVPYEAEILKRIGNWLRKNGEAVYATRPDPFFEKFDWGNITSADNRLYLHLLNLKPERTIMLPELSGRVSKVRVLSTGENCRFKLSREGLRIDVPQSIPLTGEIEVLVVEFADGYRVPQANRLPMTKAGLSLNSDNAFKYYSNSGIDYNTRFQSTIKEAWTVVSDKRRKLEGELLYTEQEKGRKIELTVGPASREIVLDGDPVQPIDRQEIPVRLGKLYINGPFYSGIEGTHGTIHSIEADKPWPQENPRPWKLQHTLEDTLDAGMMTAWYLLQELTVSNKRQFLFEVTSGEALIVYVNGREKSRHLDPEKRTGNRHLILTELEEGKNQIVVKLFNNFNRQIPFKLNFSVPQVLYTKAIGQYSVSSGESLPVAWKLSDPRTPHEHINLPNLELRWVER